MNCTWCKKLCQIKHVDLLWGLPLVGLHSGAVVGTIKKVLGSFWVESGCVFPTVQVNGSLTVGLRLQSLQEEFVL